MKEGKDVGVESTNPGLNDLLYGFMYKKYVVKLKIWITKTETWTETNAMIFSLVLQHFPKVLESPLKS